MIKDIQSAINKLVEFGLVAVPQNKGLQGGTDTEVIEFSDGLKATGYNNFYAVSRDGNHWQVELPRMESSIRLTADTLDEAVQIVCDLYTRVPPFDDNFVREIAQVLSGANIYVTREGAGTHGIIGNKIGKPVSENDGGFSIIKTGKYYTLMNLDMALRGLNHIVKSTREIHEITDYLINNF
jgi:hypothetical protein